MNTAVVNVKVAPKVKRQARAVAEELGFSLSALVNAYLKELIRTKKVSFSTHEEPTDYLLNTLKESREDIKAGRTVGFESAGEAVEYLDKMIKDDKKSAKN
jgi:addiction module RelB/DinJ family antitoxin